MTNKIKKISVVTVFKNAEKLLDETISSVLSQANNNDFEIQYIIVNGNSTDQSIEIIKKYLNYSCVEYYEREDKTMYDSLAFAIKKIKGEISCYINAGDFYYQNSLKTIKSIFDSNSEVNWLTGLKVIYNQDSEIINIDHPFRYRTSLIRSGVYGRYLPFIQQESTFWRSELNQYLDLDILKSFRNCGDLYLWNTFAKTNNLYTVNTYLSGFKYHENQITFNKTGNIDTYLSEAKKINDPIKLIDYFYIFFDLLIWSLLKKFRQLIYKNNKYIINYDMKKKLWD